MDGAWRELRAALSAQGIGRPRVAQLIDYDVRANWKLVWENNRERCERSHAGVRNPAFTPGPYSPRREDNVRSFVDWYLARIRTG
ncbi:MAG TPA: SRPBCC family protein [Solirubrobacteraceae bacterium]|nr:SRPBCC family protein [Solirubrobacteraceae bacterium]